MQLKWHQILYFHFMCVGLALSQTSTLVNLKISNITVSPGTLYNVNYLKCEVQGSPTPDVWWTKADGSYIHGREILFEDKNRTFIIWGGVPKHVGTYYCHARNSFSYVNASFQLKLIDVPSIDHIFGNGKDVHLWDKPTVVPFQLFIGQKDFSIDCYSSGYPNVQVTWKRNRVEIVDYLNASSNTRVYQRRSKHTLSGDSTLYFKKVHLHDAGNYTCESSIDGYEYVDTRFIELIVNSSQASKTFKAATSAAFTESNVTVTTSVQQFTRTIDGVVTPTQLRTLETNAIKTLQSTSTVARDAIIPSHTVKLSPVFTQYEATLSSKSTLTSTVSSDVITTTNSSILYVPHVYVTPINPTVLEKSFIVLTCNCGCSLQPHWFKNNQSIQYDERGSPYTLLANGSLRINASRHTVGNYSCEIRSGSSLTFARSKQIRLEVRYLQHCYVEGNQEIYRGQNISLTCHANGYPHPLLTWSLHGERLKTNPGIRTQANKLDISNATMNHGGQYKCVVYNEVGNVSCGVVIKVTDIPLITISTRASKYTLEGTEIHFACDTALQSFHLIERMELVKDGIPFYRQLAHNSRLYSTPRFGAQKTDTGKYQCKGTIGAASRYSSPFYLIVGVPSGPVVFDKKPESSSTGIRLSWKPISKTFWNGKEIIFQVDVLFSVEYTLVKSYKTKKNSAIISGLLPGTKYIVNITGRTVFGPMENHAVTVTTTEDVDECQNKDSNSCHKYAHCKDVVGTYICTCFDGFFGNGKECRGPAQIIEKSPTNITQHVETNVTLACTVIADPNPTIVWEHIDADEKVKEIKPTSNKFDGSITIYNARLEDSGTYLCNASNELGYDFYSTEIKIQPVIVNVSVEIKLSNKTFNEELKNKSSPAYKELKEDVYFELYNFFTDTPGFEDIEILGFVKGSVKVQFKVIVKVLKPSKERNDVVAVKVGRKIYKQLKTGRIGKFAVAPGALRLNAEPPPPANVSYSDVKETKVHIYWEPPELHELFSIQRYYISFLKHGETRWSNETIDDDQSTNFLLDNLESDTFYTLKIIAENECCLGQESKKMEIKTSKIKVVSAWYYLGAIIAIVCVILLVILICFVKRIVCSGSITLVENRRQKSKEKEGKESFLMIDRSEISKDKSTSVNNKGTFKPTWEEIPSKSIEIFKDTSVPGNFGSIVVRGTFSFNSGKKREMCSVKMLKENATTEDRRDLMNELTIISAIGPHENIVDLIGACTSEENPLLLVLEFCSLGSLESNLRDSSKSKEMFKKQNRISLANEIAKGMKHLSDSRIVHRDLAARNILMTSDFTPKISNFGLSRDIYECSSYQKLSSGKLPVRWMAIESFTDGLYTMKSDV